MTFYKLKMDASAQDKRGVFENNKCRFFNAGTMALLSPARRDDRHADHRRRCHAGHHDDNGPSPPPPHSKLSFLLFDFTFGQEFHLSRLTLAVVQQQLGEQVQGDLQIPLWQLPRPQSLSSRHSRRVRSALATTQAS